MSNYLQTQPEINIGYIWVLSFQTSLLYFRTDTWSSQEMRPWLRFEVLGMALLFGPLCPVFGRVGNISAMDPLMWRWARTLYGVQGVQHLSGVNPGCFRLSRGMSVGTMLVRKWTDVQENGQMCEISLHITCMHLWSSYLSVRLT